MDDSIVVYQFTRNEAQAITTQIHDTTQHLYQLVLKAYEGQAHEALGYSTWEAYVTAEFNMGKRYSLRLIDQAHIIQALTEVIGAHNDYLDNQGGQLATDEAPIIEINESNTRAMKPHMDEIKAEVKSSMELGLSGQEAVHAVVQKYGVPGPKLADELSRESGQMVLGSDDRYHTGMAAEDIVDIGNLQKRVFGLIRAIEAIDTIEIDPGQLIAEIPLFMSPQINKSIDRSATWLAEFRTLWSEYDTGDPEDTEHYQ